MADTKATKKSLFETLNDINVNEHTEKVKNESNNKELTYLSWTWAWAEIKKNCPDATYEIERFENNLPYTYDPQTGYMVWTKVTIQGETYEMWLPVMDSKNKAMKSEPYTYQTKYGEKTVAPATMFDINKTIMRCLVKNLAMFGLGLYIYSGEDLPETEKDEQTAKAKEEKDTDRKGILKDLWVEAGGDDKFDDWFAKKTADGFTDAVFASMRASLMKKINADAEKEKLAKLAKEQEDKS